MKWRILIVDDEPDVRTIIKATLEPKYEVLEAHDGLDALEKVDRYEPDFVLMDVMMPLMNGFESCASIRKHERFHDLPVMFLSALGSKEDMKKGYASGANMYLTKPFDPPRLLKNVDVFFERTPPAQRSRRHTIEQIREAEKGGKVPVSPGSADWQTEAEGSAPTAAPAPASAPAKPAAKPRAMIVDDDAEIVEVVRLSLEGVCEVVSASDGMQAIEKLVRYQPDLLIIDIMLPKMNGFQLCQSLRSNRAFQRLPIMICSAKGADRDKTFARRVGANEYLVKPFKPDELVSKIESLMEQPGFRVRPKSYDIKSIYEQESIEGHEDVFTADAEELRDLDRGKPTEGARNIEKFLNKEGEKEAFDRKDDEPKADEPKKKRRLFGFGRE